jgi:hypothetical protein
MGRWSKPVNAIAVAWVCFISVVLFFPPIKPVTAANMNYAICVAAVIAVVSLSWWFISAKKYGFPFRLISILILIQTQYVHWTENEGNRHRDSDRRSRVYGLALADSVTASAQSLKYFAI